MKSSGFNIEETHLADIERIERLFAIVTIAFLWACLVGITRDRLVRKIRMLKNGRRTVSFFKYGLDYIAECLLNPKHKPKFETYRSFCRLQHYLKPNRHRCFR